jgi:hypothetical protein
MHHRLSLRAVMTSVVRFIEETELGSVFDDQATKAMGEAFDAACKVLDNRAVERYLRSRCQMHHRKCEVGRATRSS